MTAEISKCHLVFENYMQSLFYNGHNIQS